MNIYDEQAFKGLTEQEIFDTLFSTIIDEEKITCLGQILERSAKLFPEGLALICHDDRNVTFHELYYYAMALSKNLIERGIQPGDRVLLLFENSLAFYVSYFGIIQAGAVVAPLNTFLTERELTHIIQDAEPKLLICSKEDAQKLRATPTTLPPIIEETDIDVTSELPARLPEFNVRKLPFEDMAALLYTSGTTGFPKGVMLSSKNILTNVMQVISRFSINKRQRLIAILPLFHSLAQNVCVWAGVLMGCTTIIVPKIERRSIFKGLAHKPTIFVGVPALYGLLALLRKADFDSVEYFFSGGDALPDKIRAAFSLIYRRKISSGYGVTEASPVVSVDMDDVNEPTNCVGRPLYGVHCEIRNNGKVLPANHIGKLWLKGDSIMLGYYHAPEITKESFADSWFCTGDLGYIDANGKIVITGREKDLIINKGFNIYPQEIENVLLLHPNVIQVGVIGDPDPMVGQVPIAYVQLRAADEKIEPALRELCKKHLAPYKIPRDFICTTEALPATATGKVDKKVLRKRLQESKANKE